MTMDPREWARVSALFEQAVELQGTARDAFIAQHCGDEPALRDALQAMLDADATTAVVDVSLADLVPADRLIEDASVGAEARLGAYRIDGVLGRGGMGVVHLAHREDDFAQKVAIKRLQQRWGSPGQAERFLQERQILANLSHPYIARLLDGGIDTQGQPWFAMEYVEGAPITQWADAQRLDLRQRIALFGKVCEAVQHAHERFVVHRDLKPDNILADAHGHPRVLDFGVAKLVDPLADGTTRTGVAVGFTPEYAAPEQLTGGAITAATDVYALGLVLYRLLTGRLPYDLDAHDLTARVDAISRHAPMRPELAITSGTPEQVSERLRERDIDAAAFRRFVRGDLTRILQTALAKEPERRYGTVQAFANDLQHFLAGRPVSVSGDTLGYRARKFIRRNPWGVAMASLAALAMLAGATGIVLQTREARMQRDAALAENARATAVREYVMLMFGSAAQRGSGGTPTAREVLQRGAEEVFVRFQDQPDTGRAALLMLAELYVQIGDHQGAVPLLERMLAWAPESQDPASLAQARDLLAGAEFQRGNAPRARELLDQAQAFWNTAPQTHALRLLESRSLQSMLERAEGKPEEGVTTVRAALDESIWRRGANDADTLKLYNNLANALLNTGHPDEAVTVAETGWKLAVDAGREASDFGIALLNVRGVANAHLRRMDEALPLFEQAVTLQRELFGPSLHLATMIQNLGNLQGITGHRTDSIASLRESITMADAHAGANSLPSLTSQILLIEALAAEGDLAEADAALAPLRARIIGQLGEGHLLAALILRAEANLRLAQGRSRDALHALDKADAALEQMGPAVAAHRTNLSGLREKVMAAR